MVLIVCNAVVMILAVIRVYDQQQGRRAVELSGSPAKSQDPCLHSFPSVLAVFYQNNYR